MLEKIKTKIEEAKVIVIGGHIRPDGDCFGSEVGLKEIIKTTFPEKEVYITGTGLPPFFDMLGPIDIIPDDKIKDALTIIVDVNEFYRVEDQRIVTLTDNFIIFDHHIKQVDYDFPLMVDEVATSCAEIITKFLIESGYEISERGANALYLGILSDSSSFRFVNEYPELFALCSYLCKKGANPHLINKILNATDLETFRIRGFVYSNYITYKDRIVYLHLTHDQILKMGIDASYGSRFVALIANARGFPIWATFMETHDGSCICEFRSNDYNVHKVATSHGGGGHMLACGVTIKNFKLEDLGVILEELYQLTLED